LSEFEPELQLDFAVKMKPAGTNNLFQLISVKNLLLRGFNG
jgi:hypothetical protein